MAQRLKTDWILFFTVIVMVCFGLVMVYSASSVMAEFRHKSSYYYLLRQAAFAAPAFLALMLFKKIDYRRFRNAGWAFAPLGIVITGLIAVYFIDPRRHRWISVFGVGLQPSEFAKPALIIFLAWFVSQRLHSINNRHTLLPPLALLAVLAGAVVAADLGTAVVLVGTAVIVFYVAGINYRYIILGAACGMLLAIPAILVKPYRAARVVQFFDPEYKVCDQISPKIKMWLKSKAKVQDTGYQARQSRIAVGSGGVTGVGLMQGKQKLLYLPEAHTDFIYAVIGEETGMFGSAAVLFGFLVILWRGLRLFFIAPDDFGRYLALGITASIVIQALINMSVVLDMAPTKGIPLPMISYGGSSLLSTLMSLGLLLSVSEHAG
jgi:cell division protein FtsW